jgi:hypothetical protein
LKEIVRHELKAHSAVATHVPTVAVEGMPGVIVVEASPEVEVAAVSGVAVADAEESAG